MTQLPEKTDGPRLYSNKAGSGSQFGGLVGGFSISGKDVKSTQENSPQRILKVEGFQRTPAWADVLGTVAQRPADGDEGGQAGH